MTTGLFDRIKSAFRGTQKIHPLDGQLAKRWIKQRLIVVFPHLRNNPAALERAYQSLNLEPRPGDEEGEFDAVFEMSGPELPE